jgi:surface antigen
MKSFFLALALVTVCTASSAYGQGAAVIIKQRAKETAGRPAAPPPAPGAQPAVGNPAPQGTVIAAPNVSKIVADLSSIKIRPQATQEHKDKLATDLSSLAVGANKPSAEAVLALASAVADAFAGKKLSSADQTALATALVGAVNAAAGSPQLAAAIQGVKDGLVIAGSNDAAIQIVVKALAGLTTKAK